jgi:hypothetical protein
VDIERRTVGPASDDSKPSEAFCCGTDDTGGGGTFARKGGTSLWNRNTNTVTYQCSYTYECLLRDYRQES